MAKQKETNFLEALSGLFVGARVEGDSGFINLMQMKDKHFESVRNSLMEEIDRRVAPGDEFREDLFDKLHGFFRRYFCESGSIYFRHLPAFARIYERAYEGGADVALMWKTRKLYYVKSDILASSMEVELDGGARFYFDASKIQNKRANERRDFVFAFAGEKRGGVKRGRVAQLSVAYSEKGRRTKPGDIVKAAQKVGLRLKEEDVQSACRKFCRQTEADFFIHKDARSFLREQFDLWLFCYAFQNGDGRYTSQRVEQFRHLQEIAYRIIDFIAQFEGELRRVWEKPKFARGVNFVVTLSKLPPKCATRKKIAKNKGMDAQIAEWRALGIVDENFTAADCNRPDLHLPLDTRHFKDLECEILSHLGDLDASLDGELIHSENWQALNTLRRKYARRVKSIYIDPPFNLDSSDQFDYRTNYKDSCWATMLENRLSIARKFLDGDGSIFIRCGHDGNHLVRCLMDSLFGENNRRNEIIVRRAEQQKGELMKQFKSMRAMMVNYDNLYWYSLNSDTRFGFIKKPANKKQARAQWHTFWKAENRPHLRYEILGVDLSDHDNGQWMWERERAYRAVENYRCYLNCCKNKSLEDYWREKKSAYQQETGKKLEFIMRKENGNGLSSVKYWMPPRSWVVSDNDWTDIKGYSNTTDKMVGAKFSTENSEVLLDRIVRYLTNTNDVTFDFFAGSGTTIAVAQKLGRKWLGVEMGEHFHTVILPRMKKILSGHQSGISKDTDYKGGGAFKYYTLEQYEETLKNARYKTDTEMALIDAEKTPFEQYVFFADDKLAHFITSEPDQSSVAGRPSRNQRRRQSKKSEISVNLQDLYPDISIAESLANIRGAQIRRQTPTEITLTNGETYKTDLAQMTESEKRALIAALKPYLWWGD